MNLKTFLHKIKSVKGSVITTATFHPKVKLADAT